ncbi:MAG: phage tail tube protein [SAR324 cluster bacterium]|nr:phage tail tube protein [SAR324 cluster bacterium]
MSDIAKKIEQLVFVTPEVTVGTFVMPNSADCLPLTGAISATQTPSYTDSPEMNSTRGLQARFQDGLVAGELSLTCLMNINAAGTPPRGAVLLTSLMGTETVNAGVDVQYLQAAKKPSFSVAYRKGHATYYVSGAVTTELKLTMADKKGAADFNFTGKFLKQITVGDDSVATLSSAAQAVVSVTDASRFMVGGYVQNKACAAASGLADSNTDLGYKIITVDLINNELTLADNLAYDWAVSEEVIGFLPAKSSGGTPLKKKDANLLLGGVEGVPTNFDLTISESVVVIENEMTSSPYPTEYVEDTRKISGSYKVYFRKDQSANLIADNDGLERELKLTLGPVGSNQLVMTLPRVPQETAKVEENGPALVLANTYNALETNGDDSASLKFI